MEEIKKLVNESGIITHNKTLNILRNNEWSALVSPYYYDSISESVRETDLLAEKQINSNNSGFGSSLQINIQLFIECKYIKQEIVFWFDKIDTEKAVENLENETGLKIAHPEGRNTGDILFKDFFHLRNENEEVAKLFSTNTNREDVIYKAMNQCLHSQIYHRSTGKKPIANEFNNHRDSTSRIVQRPVIICDNFDKLLKIKFNDSDKYEVEAIKNHFVMETNYRDEYFLIDIVDINYLPQFLESVEKETRSIMAAHLSKR